eukprot:4151942-Prymnesium_polylepis.1
MEQCAMERLASSMQYELTGPEEDASTGASCAHAPKAPKGASAPSGVDRPSPVRACRGVAGPIAGAGGACAR